MHATLAFDRYLVQLKANGRSPHTCEQAARHIRVLYQWMVRELGGSELALLGHEELAKFLTSDAVARKSNGEPKKPSSLNALRSTLRAFFAYTSDAGITPGNPARLVKRAVVGEPVPRAMSDREVDALRSALTNATSESDRRDRVLFELLLATGLRIGSALALDISDLDLVERTIWVRTMKRGGQTMVAIDETLAALLSDFVGERRSGPLFASLAGAALTPRSIQRRLQRALMKAGIRRHYSAHALRHTRAVRLLAETKDIELVREALGHASIATTGRYLRVERSRQRGTRVG